jgi:hypothetical protein
MPARGPYPRTLRCSARALVEALDLLAVTVVELLLRTSGLRAGVALVYHGVAEALRSPLLMRSGGSVCSERAARGRQAIHELTNALATRAGESSPRSIHEAGSLIEALEPH